MDVADCIALFQIDEPQNTIEYLGEWEKLYNLIFNCTEFDTIRNAAGSNNFVLSVKAWIQTDATSDKQIGNALRSQLAFSVISRCKLTAYHRLRIYFKSFCKHSISS